MTQLSCIYCGRKLQIKGKCTYGKGRCPSCRHIIFIPKRDHVEELSSEEAIVKRANFDYQKNTTDKNKRDWSKLSDEQIKQNLKGSDTAVFGSLLPR
jgi:DNA-directed RNA polymerase subunit RPC12/RpoP